MAVGGRWDVGGSRMWARGRAGVAGAVVVSAGLLVGVAGAADAAQGEIEQVSLATSGTQGNRFSDGPSVSADGRIVAFRSLASNLVPGDTNGSTDVFVHDRVTGQTSRVSVSSTGAQGNEYSYSPSVSGDGRFVAFDTDASNLVPGDTNGCDEDCADVFLHDRVTGQTSRVSVSSSGAQGNGWSGDPSVSGDGRFVAFSSLASNLVPGDTNDTHDVFVHDRVTGQTARVSVSSSGTQSDLDSWSPSISGDGRIVAFEMEDVFVHDRATGRTTRVSVSSTGGQANQGGRDPSVSAHGRFVAFTSEASNLVPGDTNRQSDVFVHDRRTGETSRVSVSSQGAQGNDYGFAPSVSGDGRFVAFTSDASNLVPGDTNDTHDVFIHDRVTGQTSRVNVSSAGAEANGFGWGQSVNGNGRFVAFDSNATNLVPDDTNRRSDVFVAQPRWNTGACTIIGTQGGDVMVGTPNADVICGRGGDDVIRAGGGRDRVYGGPGEDIIYGGAGADRVRGGAGDDRVHGGKGDDVLSGREGADGLRGGAGNDRIYGEQGPDTIIGGVGRDRLVGNLGDDTFWARDSWKDTVNGGPGADRARIDRAKDVLTRVETQF